MFGCIMICFVIPDLLNKILIKLHLKPKPETCEEKCEGDLPINSVCVPSSQVLRQEVLKENAVSTFLVSNQRIARIYAVLWYDRPANRLPLLILTGLRLLLAAFFIATAVYQLLTENPKAVFVLLVFSVLLITQSKWLLNQYLKIENQFLSNLQGEPEDENKKEEE